MNHLLVGNEILSSLLGLMLMFIKISWIVPDGSVQLQLSGYQASCLYDHQALSARNSFLSGVIDKQKFVAALNFWSTGQVSGSFSV